jgi:hypothetical protein
MGGIVTAFSYTGGFRSQLFCLPIVLLALTPLKLPVRRGATIYDLTRRWSEVLKPSPGEGCSFV